MLVPTKPSGDASKGRPQRAIAVEKLFPFGVKAFETHGGGSMDDLFPSEREYILGSVDKRVSEFAAGRLCARSGLIELGHGPSTLPADGDRMPIWPHGVVGSITHTDGYCAAVVGLEATFAAIGLDAECIGHMGSSLWALVMHAEELRRLESLEEAMRQRTATVIFSAKEAFYKCQYAITRRWLGFKEVIVEIADDTFELSVVEERHPIRQLSSSWMGRFSINDALVVTGISVGV